MTGRPGKSDEIALELAEALERVLRGTQGYSASEYLRLLKQAPLPSGRSGGPGSAMAFFLLRRAIAPFWREVEAGPSTPLANQELPLPRKLAKRLAGETGLELPPTTMSMIGLLVAGALVTAALLSFLWNWPVIGVAAIILAMLALKFDPGEYSRDWASLGSLARATAALNFAGEGATREAEAENMRIFSELLAGTTLARSSPVYAVEDERGTVLEFKRPTLH